MFAVHLVLTVWAGCGDAMLSKINLVKGWHGDRSLEISLRQRFLTTSSPVRRRPEGSGPEKPRLAVL